MGFNSEFKGLIFLSLFYNSNCLSLSLMLHVLRPVVPITHRTPPNMDDQQHVPKIHTYFHCTYSRLPLERHTLNEPAGLTAFSLNKP